MRRKIFHLIEKIHLETVEDVNVRKKLTGQMRLYSTREQRAPKNDVHKPSINDTDAKRNS